MCDELGSQNNGGAFKQSIESESPCEGAGVKMCDEAESPNEGDRQRTGLRYLFTRLEKCTDSDSPNGGAGLRNVMNRHV